VLASRAEHGTIGVIWTNIQLYVTVYLQFTAITNEYASFTYILPTVKQGNAFVITGKLIDAVTLQPLSALIDAAHKRLPSQSYSLDILNSTRKVIKDGLKDS